MVQRDLEITDYRGKQIRLPAERQQHILDHPEIDGQIGKIIQTLENPELVVATEADPSVQVYHRYFETTPVTSKFLLVSVKWLENDAFVLTAFFSRREKRGTTVWKP